MDKEERKMLEHGPLEFMAGRLYDILVIPKFVKGGIRRVTVIYEENGRVSSFEYDLNDPKFGHEKKKMVNTAIKSVINEIKSRVLSGHMFTTWFLEPRGMQWTIQEVRRVGDTVIALKRYADMLEESAKLVRDKSSVEEPSR